MPMNEGISAVSSSIGMFFYLKTCFYIILVLMLFANGIYSSYEQKSVKPFFEDVGGRIFKTTEMIQKESQAVIDNKGIYNTDDSFLTKWRKILLFASGLLSCIALICAWLYLLYWLWGHSFVSVPDNWFTNMFLSITTFYLLQMLYILVTAGLSNKLTNWNSVTYYILVPLTALMTLIRAVPYIISPMSNALSHVANSTIR